MLGFLKNHPFAVEAFFERSLVLTFAAVKEEVAALVPPCLEVDTFDDRWGFIAVALVETTGLRPKGFPLFLGSDFFLIGYRAFVRYRSLAGRRLRGLYILKSETNRRRMEFLGNVFTHYRYATTDIRQTATARCLEFRSVHSDLCIAIRQAVAGDELPLPPHTPFADWRQARAFAGPMPFTFSFDARRREVLVVEGVRRQWEPRPVEVLDYHVGFLKALPLTSPELANAFVVEKVPYYWKKGRTEPWNG